MHVAIRAYDEMRDFARTFHNLGKAGRPRCRYALPLIEVPLESVSDIFVATRA